MSLSYISNSIQNFIGCFHSETNIKKVQVSVANDHPKYCVLGNCKRCGSDNSYVVSHPRDSDYKSVQAASWLAANNFDFVTGKPLNKEQ